MKKVSLLIVFCVVVLLLTSCFVVTKKIDDEKIPVKNEPPVEDDKIVSEDVIKPVGDLTEKITLTLYFPDSDALYLYPEQREIEVHPDELLAPRVLEELFKGPQNEDLSPSLDGKELVLSVSVGEGLCTVDFKEDFALLNSGGSARETFAIGSIVNSLCELEGIEKVKINIGGNTDAAFGGHFTLEAPFSPQRDLIAK